MVAGKRGDLGGGSGRFGLLSPHSPTGAAAHLNYGRKFTKRLAAGDDVAEVFLQAAEFVCGF